MAPSTKVVSRFGSDADGGVSLPRFLCFLGKEYKRRGGVDGEGMLKSGGLGGRLRLVLKKVGACRYQRLRATPAVAAAVIGLRLGTRDQRSLCAEVELRVRPNGPLAPLAGYGETSCASSPWRWLSRKGLGG